MPAKLSPLAGKPIPPEMLLNAPRLMTAYFVEQPDVSIPAQRVKFGTSGHRGSAFDRAFNEWHILATTQAICDYRRMKGIDGPLYVGIDTHALSEAALASALEVLIGNEVAAMIDSRGGYTPTPLVSHAILTYNAKRQTGMADGIVITPSHNPPEEGGFKYNPPNGGPADVDATDWIERAANELIARKLEGVKRIPYARAKAQAGRHDFISAYVEDLTNVVDMDAIRGLHVNMGIDPLGGASVHVWPAIIERYRLSATIVNGEVDCTFRFMTADWDGKIRMDCSSPYAMAHALAVKDAFDVVLANDTDADRFGIVSRAWGLINPNHYLAAAIAYLYRNRPQWRGDAAVGKTVVSSSMIDRVTAKLGRKLVEVPVGFKWFVEGLLDSSLGFGGEESAGASFLRSDGAVWTTDKDGIILGLLAAEITARLGRNPGELYEELENELGRAFYERIDADATSQQKAKLKSATPEQVNVKELAGEPVTAVLSRAPGNNQPIGGIKVAANSGWFAARPSGTEDVYKIYAESFKSDEHLKQIQCEAQALISRVFGS